MREIGSEFWEVETGEAETRLLLSGRTALELILRDIEAEGGVQSALLPSYCCHTMIEPFLRRGLRVRFYDVYWDGAGLAAELPEAREGEVLLALKYFGYRRLSGWDPEAARRWRWIVEDRTHTWLNGDEEIRADYSFASYRKWTGISGVAAARKRAGRFAVGAEWERNARYEALRREARERKARWLRDGTGEKAEFLNCFARAEELLEEDYVNYAPELEGVVALMNLDAEALRARREGNARLLAEELRGVPGLKLMNERVADGDAPLCVPILVDAERRDALRKWLIEREIYCPVHWPLSDMHAGIGARGAALYGQELSLICDQRYGPEDMLRESAAVREYFEETN